MAVLSLALMIVAEFPLSPPGASLADALFGYISIALLVGLVVWNEKNAANPPRQE